jgi:hypothetical protein
MRFAAVACLAALMTLHSPAVAQEGPQEVPAEPPLAAIVAHFFPGYAPVTLGDLAAEIGALTVKDAMYDHSDRSPTAIRADFDGNGHADYAVLIKKQSASGSDEIFAVLLGHGQGRYATAMESFFGRLSEDIYLGYVPAGTRIRRTVAAPVPEPDPIRLAAPAVTLNVRNEASDVLYWDATRDMFSRARVAD